MPLIFFVFVGLVSVE